MRIPFVFMSFGQQYSRSQIFESLCSDCPWPWIGVFNKEVDIDQLSCRADIIKIKNPSDLNYKILENQLSLAISVKVLKKLNLEFILQEKGYRIFLNNFEDYDEEIGSLSLKEVFFEIASWEVPILTTCGVPMELLGSFNEQFLNSFEFQFFSVDSQIIREQQQGSLDSIRSCLANIESRKLIYIYQSSKEKEILDRNNIPHLSWRHLKDIEFNHQYDYIYVSPHLKLTKYLEKMIYKIGAWDHGLTIVANQKTTLWKYIKTKLRNQYYQWHIGI